MKVIKKLEQAWNDWCCKHLGHAWRVITNNRYVREQVCSCCDAHHISYYKGN